MASLRSPYIPGGAVGVVTITAGGRRNSRRLDNLARELPQRAQNVARIHAGLVQHWARAFAPVQQENDLGYMQKKNDLSIREGIVVQQISPYRFAVVAAAPHSAAQEFGSTPHAIPASNKPLLVFYWQRKGVWVRTRRIVNHPGNPPHPFMLPARRKVAASFYRELRRIFTDASIPWAVIR